MKSSGDLRRLSGEELVSVGKIGKVSGITGEVKLQPYLEPDDLSKITRFFVNKKGSSLIELRVERIGQAVSGALVMKFAGIENREQAREIAGLELLARPEDLPRTGEWELYAFELVGMSVLGPGGELLGVVEELIPTPSYFILEAGNLSLPLTREFVSEIDREKGIVRLKRL